MKKSIVIIYLIFGQIFILLVFLLFSRLEIPET